MPRPSVAAEKVCERCGATYQPRSNRQRFCSLDCKVPPRACEVCGKVFQPPRHSSGRACSRRCGKILMWNTWGRAAEKPCRQCGKMMPGTRPNDFCSRACMGLASRKPGVCAKCGKPTARMRNRYCSKHCARLGAAAHRRRAQIGARQQDKSGYLLIKTGSGHDGWRREHRLVMEQFLGRPLMKHEHIHHRNGQRDDNRIENLELWGKVHPTGVRLGAPHCPTCHCYKATTEE